MTMTITLPLIGTSKGNTKASTASNRIARPPSPKYAVFGAPEYLQFIELVYLRLLAKVAGEGDEYPPGYDDAHVKRARKRLIEGLREDRFNEYLTVAREWRDKAKEYEDKASRKVGDCLAFYVFYCDGLKLCCIEAFNEARLNQLLKKSEEQAKRRRDKPANSDDHDPFRNERVRQMHARLKAGGEHDATKQVAKEFGLSVSQIRRIVRGRA